jgi:double-stranded uracil-DNA glycosylase
MPRIASFSPNIDQRCNRLILGSMPGVESLNQQQYYAHPRNLFWTFMEELLGISAELPYETRLKLLLENGIALWDSAGSCTRPGSLDSNIRDVVPNDFEVLFKQYPAINKVFFNGRAAENLFKRHTRNMSLPELQYIPLPSTSPANASISREKKLERWQQVI